MRDGLDAILRNERKIAVVLGPGTWGLNFMMSLEIFLCYGGECAHCGGPHDVHLVSFHRVVLTERRYWWRTSQSEGKIK
jgi:hypothetical protein